MLNRVFRSSPSEHRRSDVAALPSPRRIVAQSSLRVVTTLVVTAASLLMSSGTGSAQGIDENLWVTNGTVRTVVRDGGTIYVGGGFSQVGPATGPAVPIDAGTGALPPAFPKVAGSRVFAVVSDGTGGWYIGGSFTAVGGVPRSNL